MDILKRHEIFEIELLEKLKNSGFTRPLVFGGGTMLRLCYEMNRYSTDLDFWFIKKVDQAIYFNKLKNFLRQNYELTDAQMKYYTLLFEVRSAMYPKKLKIEIRKEPKGYEFEDKIAFSRYGTKQVLLRVITLEQAMKNKISAGLDRKDIRDFFDIEFLLRQGVELRAGKSDLDRFKKIIAGFKDSDYKVALGSVLDSRTREYYIKDKFDYLIRKITNAIE